MLYAYDQLGNLASSEWQFATSTLFPWMLASIFILVYTGGFLLLSNELLGIFKSLPKVLLEYLPWCLAQDFWKMATGWWTILNFEAAVPDSDIGPGSIAMSHSTIGIWGFVIENYILGDGYQTFGAVRGHPKNWLGLLVEDLGRWSSVRRTVLQV